MVLNGAGFFGRILPNFFVDKTGVWAQLTPCAVICGALMIAFIGIHDAAGIMTIAVLYGFFNGASESLSAPIYCDSKSSSQSASYLTPQSNACIFDPRRHGNRVSFSMLIRCMCPDHAHLHSARMGACIGIGGDLYDSTSSRARSADNRSYPPL